MQAFAFNLRAMAQSGLEKVSDSIVLCAILHLTYEGNSSDPPSRQSFKSFFLAVEVGIQWSLYPFFPLVPHNYDTKTISEDGGGGLQARGGGQSGLSRFLTHDPGLVIT